MNVSYFDILLAIVWSSVLTLPVAYVSVKICEFVDATVRRFKK